MTVTVAVTVTVTVTVAVTVISMHHKAKHDFSIVQSARSMRDRGKTYGQISQRLGVKYFTVRDLCDYRARII